MLANLPAAFQLALISPVSQPRSLGMGEILLHDVPHQLPLGICGTSIAVKIGETVTGKESCFCQAVEYMMLACV